MPRSTPRNAVSMIPGTATTSAASPRAPSRAPKRASMPAKPNIVSTIATTPAAWPAVQYGMREASPIEMSKMSGWNTVGVISKPAAIRHHPANRTNQVIAASLQRRRTDGRRSRPRCDESTLVSHHDGLYAVAQRQVRLDRRLGQVQLAGHLGIGVAVGDEPKDVYFCPRACSGAQEIMPARLILVVLWIVQMAQFRTVLPILESAELLVSINIKEYLDQSSALLQ